MVIHDLMMFVGLFFLWTLCIYFMHRIAHIQSKFNPFYQIHLSHHKINYLKKSNRKFQWYYFLFYFGSLYATLDVIFILTFPAFLMYWISPQYGLYIVGFHYLYEVFLSEGTLDHNPKI